VSDEQSSGSNHPIYLLSRKKEDLAGQRVDAFAVAFPVIFQLCNKDEGIYREAIQHCPSTVVEGCRVAEREHVHTLTKFRKTVARGDRGEHWEGREKTTLTKTSSGGRVTPISPST
jgi:hypothetical protein